MVPFNTASIKKTTQNSRKNPVLILASKNADWAKLGFNAQEIVYIKTKIKDEQELIVLNAISEIVYIRTIIESKDKPQHYINEQYRKTGNTLCGLLNAEKIATITLSGAKQDASSLLCIAEGLALSSYQFLKYKSTKKVNSLKLIEILCDGITDNDIEELNSIIESTCIARTLVNEPQNFLTATELSKQISEMGKKAGFKVEVFNKAKIKSLKMGGLLAVNLGSQLPPTFTVMEYKPRGAKNKKPLILVGKGVVYDTGGLSLKPTPNGMDTMKCDMAGAAAVASTIYGIAKMNLPYYVIGLVPATDNRPGENAYVPGDVITMMSGHTVEMLNADAEGRMILADALHYAKKYKPQLVIDLATLTGAAAAAIGQYGIVAMGTATEEQKNKLKASGENVYERLVELPFWDEYKDLLKSDLADMKNIGGPVAGAITAGKFLEYYIDYPWMHFDIAGSAYTSSNDNYRGKNGTGSGVRLLIDFIKSGLK
ncbi:MAG: leucyl aminopeptidase [Bacteroidota bacterium]|nr:leucyl aminopeptidase [Bacteroidota bacterium]